MPEWELSQTRTGQDPHMAAAYCFRTACLQSTQPESGLKTLPAPTCWLAASACGTLQSRFPGFRCPGDHDAVDLPYY